MSGYEKHSGHAKAGTHSPYHRPTRMYSETRHLAFSLRNLNLFEPLHVPRFHEPIQSTGLEGVTPWFTNLIFLGIFHGTEFPFALLEVREYALFRHRSGGIPSSQGPTQSLGNHGVFLTMYHLL